MVTTDRSKIIKPLAVSPISVWLLEALSVLEEAKDSLCAGKLYHSKPASTEKIVLMEHLNRSKGVKDENHRNHANNIKWCKLFKSIRKSSAE